MRALSNRSSGCSLAVLSFLILKSAGNSFSNRRRYFGTSVRLTSLPMVVRRSLDDFPKTVANQQRKIESTLINFLLRWQFSGRKGPYALRHVFNSLHKNTVDKAPMFVWLSTDRSGLRSVERRPLPFSTLSFRRSML